MDGSRFDSLTRALTTARSRRRVARFLAGALASALGLGAVREVGAGDQCRLNRDCEKEFGEGKRWWCQRVDGLGKRCLYECGGDLCFTNQVCLDRRSTEGSRCWYRCQREGGRCYYGNPFADGECSGGVCYRIPYLGKRCHDYGPDCRQGAICDAPRGQWGTCVCRKGETVCGEGTDARCRNLQTDPANCGTCGFRCRKIGGIGCRDGRCVCPEGQTRCGTGENTRCHDLQSDVLACGNCRTQCQARTQDCRNGRCCTRDGVSCPSGCGPGGRCGRCCSGVCRLDGTCGTVSGTECLAKGADCPSGCEPGKVCPGCCDRTCNSEGQCSPDGCVLYDGPCTDSADCCDDVPCISNLCRFP